MIPLHIFESVRNAAASLNDPRIRSQLLAELAQQQLLTKQFDDALKTFADIPDVHEKRIALLTADFADFPTEKTEPLIKLLQASPQTNLLTGQIALAMLNANNIEAAWKLVETAEEPFETEQQHYEFVEQMLTKLNDEHWEHFVWDRLTRLYRTFPLGMYRDWAALALIKYLTQHHQFDTAERFANTLSMPTRTAWAYWEMSRMFPPEHTKRYFDKATEVAEAIEIVQNDDDMMEVLSILLRVLGRIAFERTLSDNGDWERLLHRSEAAAASVGMPMLRYRLQCFLGKVLTELGMIASIGEYLPIEQMLTSLSSPSERARVSVWLAESGWNEGWTHAVNTLSMPQRGELEHERAKQIADVLKRATAHRQGLKPTGDFAEDSVRLSGEAFETFYFNPFAMADCGCY